MKQEKETEELQDVVFEPDSGSPIETILKNVILGYQNGYNKHNDKYEIELVTTITNHKVPTEEGNKDVAYLRIDRSIRAKPKEGEEPEEWQTMLIHQDMHFFKNMQERLNPKAPWKDQLYMQAITRLCFGGLEYAEFLRRAKALEEAEKHTQKSTEEKLGSLGLVHATEMPKALNKEDEAYKEWLNKERAKEGL